MKGYIAEQVKEIKNPAKFAAFEEAFSFSVVGAGLCKVIYRGASLAAYEGGAGKENLPNAIIETETMQDAIALLATPEYNECIAAAGGDMAAVAIRDIRVFEAEEGWFKPGKGYWHSHYDAIVDESAFAEYYHKSATTFIGPGAIGPFNFTGPGVLGAKVSIPLKPHPPEKLIFYCRTTSASTAPCTSRRMCCPTHCATYCAPSQPLLRVISGWIRSPPFCNGAFSMMQGLAVLSRSLTLGWCYQTWGDNISVLSDCIGLPADYNTDNSGHKELSRGETHVSVCPCSFMLVQHSVRLSSTKCAPLSARRIVSPCRGTSLIRPPPPQHPTVASCLGAYGGPGGGCASYERDTPL